MRLLLDQNLSTRLLTVLDNLYPGSTHVREVGLQTDHGPLPAISLTQIPVDRPPYPLPPGTTFFFTPQGHGAQVLRADGTPNPTGIRIILPNVDHLPAGTRVDLTHYNYYRGGWST